MGRSAVVSLVVAVCLGGAARAQAAELAYRAPHGCPSAEDVELQVEHLVGGRLEDVKGLNFSIELQQQSANSWKLLLLTRGGSPDEEPRKREIVGKSCAEVTDAAAVAIALASTEQRERARAGDTNERERLSAAAPPTNAVPAPSPAVSAPAPARTESAATAQRPPASIGFRTGISGVIDFGALPQPAFGAELGIALVVADFSAVASGALFAPQRERVASGGAGEFQLTLAALSLGYARSRESYRAQALLGVELGSLSARGREVTKPYERRDLWLALRGGLGFAYVVSPGIAFELRGLLIAPLRRTQFVLDNEETVHRPAGLGGRALLGVEFTW